MGTSYQIECSACGYSKGFVVGIGMAYDRSSVLALSGENALLPSIIRSKKTIAQIRELVEEKHAVLADGYGHAIYRCPDCGNFYGRFFLHLDYQGGSYEVIYRCHVCKKPLVLFYNNSDESIRQPDKSGGHAELACPKCGKSSLIIMSNLILWD